jgi:MerR family copper efflux transcriptional regulator
MKNELYYGDNLDVLRRKIAELESMAGTLEHLTRHCHGDHRPDCPILKELASGCCAQPARA